jgi:hypothetical protein
LVLVDTVHLQQLTNEAALAALHAWVLIMLPVVALALALVIPIRDLVVLVVPAAAEWVSLTVATMVVSLFPVKEITVVGEAQTLTVVGVVALVLLAQTVLVALVEMVGMV